MAELSAALGFAELLRNHQFCDVWTICEQAPIVQTSQYCSFVVCKSLCLALLKPAAVVRSNSSFVVEKLVFEVILEAGVEPIYCTFAI